MPHHNYTKTQEHIFLKNQIKILKQQNLILIKRNQKLQDAMHQIYLSKKKYKTRYKEVKQKLDILQTVYSNRSDQNVNLESSQYYKNYIQNENVNSRQTNNHFFLKKNNLAHYAQRQDLTANTVQTMPSSRQSEFMNVIKRNKNSGYNRNTTEQYSQSKNQQLLLNIKKNQQFQRSKDVGKIFKLKSQQKQIIRYPSSGSQTQNLGKPINIHQSPSSVLKRFSQKNQFSPSNNKTYSQQFQGDHNIKELILNLLSQLKLFSGIYNNNNDDDNLLERDNKILKSQVNVRQKLQEICSKLKQIQSNQQLLVMKSQQKEQRIINTKIKSQKSLNKSSTGKMNTSFLKTIEDIGKDLTEWKIDYYFEGT